ncbi:MAG: hypothetical protein HY975_01435 [Candidatus Kerfeldbacteria bacterium]|nr:hypothetical protein [Candidatus Kerfeldbacteria bacterium]
MRVYLRTYDRNAAEWVTNQDYVRVELDPIAGTVTLGQRVNGPWSTISDNETLTATIATGNASFNDLSQHTLAVRLDGLAATVTLDGQAVASGTLSEPAPTTGYVQWKVLGTSSVYIDDFLVNVIDTTIPVAPTGGTIIINGLGAGSASAQYTFGPSTDATSLVVYESLNPISPSTDPATLTQLGAGGTSTAISFTGATAGRYYALAVRDLAGNISQLTSVVPDVTAPAAVLDLR